jgi:transposase
MPLSALIAASDRYSATPAGVSGRWLRSAPNDHHSRGSQPLLPARNQLRPAGASRLRSVWTGKAYQGRFARQVPALAGPQQVATRPPNARRGFVPVAKRWVVERTFA